MVEPVKKSAVLSRMRIYAIPVPIWAPSCAARGSAATPRIVVGLLERPPVLRSPFCSN